MKRFLCFETMAVLMLVAEIAHAQTTTRVSVNSNGAGGDNESYLCSISTDGRFVAFTSLASNLVAGDTNMRYDVFVYDRDSGISERVSLATGGAQGNAQSEWPSLSADGRFVAFQSFASNLVGADTNRCPDIFIHDRQSGTTERVSVASGGAEADFGGQYPSVSGDGRFVAFWSDSSNLVPSDTNGRSDVFVHDRLNGTTERVSVATGGIEGNYTSDYPSISADGRFVAFQSGATNLVSGDTNGGQDVFVHDRQSSTTDRVSVATGGAEGNTGSSYPSISADGRFVAFSSSASTLVGGDTNARSDFFVRDLQSGTTERVSIATGGAQGNENSGSLCDISTDGRYVAFDSGASNLVGGDTNGRQDVFIHDLQSGTTERVSVATGWAQGNFESGIPSISANGRFVAFQSLASNFVVDDTNATNDVFVRDRNPGSIITPFCFGDASRNLCPCNNIGQPGHGCNNSISTGGALLAGSGQASLSADTLLLTSSNERPTAFSLFWQGGSEVAPRVFGDGLGCMGSPLKRMYRHNAVGGTVAAPQGADPSVSARSAALGDPIIPGTIRIYHVFYRDPAPGYCDWPLGSTFNVSSGLRVIWGQ